MNWAWRWRRLRDTHPMWGVYATLVLLIVATVVATLLLADRVTWIDRFGPNLATETFGIVVTLLIIRRVLEQQERAHKLRGSVGALRKAGGGLSTLVSAWGSLLKGALHRMPVERPHAIDGFFLPYIIENLEYCDPRRERAGDGVRQPWTQWATQRFAEAQATLNEVIMAYGASLDPTYVEAIDELIDDPFLALIRELGSTAPDPQRWRTRINAVAGLRDAHFTRLMHAIERHNELAGEAARFRNPDTAPRAPTLGIGRALDHDLRVDTAISPEWWSQPPRPGSLVADRSPPVTAPATSARNRG